jgi:hypothetical protein
MSDGYSVIQDFDNKRANAHASLFVASMFGSFAILSLMDRLLNPIDRSKVFSSSNYVIFGLLFSGYVLVGLFGAYSLLNFFFYATTSQHAERKIIGGKEKEVVEETKKGLKGILKWFADFKVHPSIEPEPKEKASEKETSFIDRSIDRIKGRNQDIFVALYVLIISLPMLAFFIRFFCG